MFLEILEVFPNATLAGFDTVAMLRLSAVEVSGSAPWVIFGAVLLTRAMLCFGDRGDNFPERLFGHEDV